MNAYDGSNGYTYTPNVMTYDLGSTTDFVDSTTFDQRQQLDSVPDSNCLSVVVSPPSINTNAHIGNSVDPVSPNA